MIVASRPPAADRLVTPSAPGRSLRIAYLHQFFCTPEMSGATRSYEMAKCLVAAGHQVEMITSRREPSGDRRKQWSVTDVDGIRVHWFPVEYANAMSHGKRLRAFARFAKECARRARAVDADVVFASSAPLTIAIPGVFAARTRGIPLVLEVRDLWPDVPIAMGALRSPLLKAGARWLERIAYANSAWVVALSPAMKDGVTRTGYPADQVSVIPNACDVGLFDVGPGPGTALRTEHAWLGDRPLVIYTGTFGQVNGVSYLVRVAAEMRRLDPTVCFVAIGKGMEYDRVRRTAAELGVLDANFFLLPSRPKTEIPAWHSAADLTTSTVIDVPALWANSANKVFDGFAAGRPVAINHEGWLADLLRETDAGVVLDPRDHVRAAQSLLARLRDRPWMERARAAARALAYGRLNRQHLGAELERVLRSVALGATHGTPDHRHA